MKNIWSPYWVRLVSQGADQSLGRALGILARQAGVHKQATPGWSDAHSYLLQSCWPWVQGEGGYLRITRKVNDCGVASEPVYVELRPQGRF